MDFGDPYMKKYDMIWYEARKHVQNTYIFFRLNGMKAGSKIMFLYLKKTKCT